MHKKASADYIGGKGFDPAVTVVDAGNYDEIVANSDKDVLFDLYAPWCILCARNKPVYEELAKRISEVINGLLEFRMLRTNIQYAYHASFLYFLKCLILYSNLSFNLFLPHLIISLSAHSFREDNRRRYHLLCIRWIQDSDVYD